MESVLGASARYQTANRDALRSEDVRKLSRVQPMLYKYVKIWFENRFPYYSEQPTFDADGFVDLLAELR